MGGGRNGTTFIPLPTLLSLKHSVSGNLSAWATAFKEFSALFRNFNNFEWMFLFLTEKENTLAKMFVFRVILLPVIENFALFRKKLCLYTLWLGIWPGLLLKDIMQPFITVRQPVHCKSVLVVK